MAEVVVKSMLFALAQIMLASVLLAVVGFVLV